MSLTMLAASLFVMPAANMSACIAILVRFGRAALQSVRRAGITIRLLQATETYESVSPTIGRLSLNFAAWPHAPAGLFVVEERRMYVRVCTAMTVAHEFGHALDCALGEGSYHSEQSACLQTYFREAGRWITPYAATRIDEYFAEGFRAYVNANDPHSRWPRATRRRLRLVDPRLAAYFDELRRCGFSVGGPPTGSNE